MPWNKLSGGAGGTNKEYIIKEGNLLARLTNVSGTFSGETVDGLYRFKDTSASVNALAKITNPYSFGGNKVLYVEGYAPSRQTSSVGTNANGNITNVNNVTNRTNLTATLGTTTISPSSETEYVYLISLDNNNYTYVKNMWIE